MSASFLNGSVHSQGIKIDHPCWLDLGSVCWEETSDKVKAAAYQAAKVCGWTDQGLKKIILSEFGDRVDQFMADVIIEVLQDLAKLHPIEVEQVYEANKENPLFKVHGTDLTIRLPLGD